LASLKGYPGNSPGNLSTNVCLPIQAELDRGDDGEEGAGGEVEDGVGVVVGEGEDAGGAGRPDRPEAGDDQGDGDVDRVEDRPARLQREVEGGAEEQEAGDGVDAVEVDPEDALGRRPVAEVEARLGEQPGDRPADLEGG